MLACIYIITVAHSIMEAHGGSIGVYSEGEDSGGSVFYIDIPVSNAVMEPQLTDHDRRMSNNETVNYTVPKPHSTDTPLGIPALKRRSIRDLLQGVSSKELSTADMFLELVDMDPSVHDVKLVLPLHKSSKSTQSSERAESISRLPLHSLPPYDSPKSPSHHLQRNLRKQVVSIDPLRQEHGASSGASSAPESRDSLNSLTSSRDSWMSLSPVRGSTHTDGGKTALIVDDSSAIRKMAGRLLRDMNCNNVIDHASDGKVAVEKVATLMREKRREYDVIMMDYMVSVCIHIYAYMLLLSQLPRSICAVDAKYVRSRCNSSDPTAWLQRLDRRCVRQLPAVRHRRVHCSWREQGHD